MKVIKEAMNNVPDIENTIKGTVDVVMAKAKTDAEENQKKFEEIVEPATELDRKEAFVGAENQPEPEEAEKELEKIKVDEALAEEVIDDIAEDKKYFKQNGLDPDNYIFPKMNLDEDLFDDEENTENQLDELTKYNLGFALDSELDRQEAINICNKLLNILNNVPTFEVDDSEQLSIDGIDVEESLNEVPEYSNAEKIADKDDVIKAEPLDEENDRDLPEGELAQCEWCDEETPIEDLVKTDLGWICPYCIRALDSHGEEYRVYGNADYYDEHDGLYEGYDEIPSFVSRHMKNGNAFEILGYTANAMKECGLRDEIGEMRERAMSSNYQNLLVVCDEYIQKCNEIVAEYDDDYQVEGLEFVTDGCVINEAVEPELPAIGTKIRITSMEGEPHYEGKEGEIKFIDDAGQLHGSWGGLAVIPEVDQYEIIG